jgi:hypothetical protein
VWVLCCDVMCEHCRVCLAFVSNTTTSKDILELLSNRILLYNSSGGGRCVLEHNLLRIRHDNAFQLIRHDTVTLRQLSPSSDYCTVLAVGDAIQIAASAYASNQPLASMPSGRHGTQ